MKMPIGPDLSVRRRVPELMDQPGLDAAAHRRALRGLRRINRISRSPAILWGPIRRLASESGGASLRVLDLASGGGDVAVALARKAVRAGVALEISGCDVSPVAVDEARANADAARVPVRFFEHDALAGELPAGFDVLTCSLFLHHLGEDEAIALLRRMAGAAGRMVLVNDLVRSRLGYWMAWAGCRLLSRSPVVHYDGPVSVAGAFTVGEVRRLAERAGMGVVTITRHWPQRFSMEWRSSAPSLPS